MKGSQCLKYSEGSIMICGSFAASRSRKACDGGEVHQGIHRDIVHKLKLNKAGWWSRKMSINTKINPLQNDFSDKICHLELSQSQDQPNGDAEEWTQKSHSHQTS